MRALSVTSVAAVSDPIPHVEELPEQGVLVYLVPSPFSIEGGKIEAKGALHTVLGGSY